MLSFSNEINMGLTSDGVDVQAEVRDEYYKDGMECDSARCPIAKSINHHLRPEYFARAYRDYFYICLKSEINWKWDKQTRYRSTLPRIASNLMLKFDAKDGYLTCKPISFRVRILAHLLKTWDGYHESQKPDYAKASGRLTILRTSTGLEVVSDAYVNADGFKESLSVIRLGSEIAREVMGFYSLGCQNQNPNGVTPDDFGNMEIEVGDESDFSEAIHMTGPYWSDVNAFHGIFCDCEYNAEDEPC